MSCTADRTAESSKAEHAATTASGTEPSVSLLRGISIMGVHGTGADDPLFAQMKMTKQNPGTKVHGGLALLLLLALDLTACKPKSYEPAGEAAEAARPPSFSVTPPIPAGPDDLFEDVTAKARIDFVQQFCDERIANILESNGSGVVVFDYDNDGLHGPLLRQSGPIAGRDARGAGNPAPAQPPLPQQRRRHVHRRDGEGRSRRRGLRGLRPPRPITTATALRTSMSSTPTARTSSTTTTATARSPT